MVALTLPVASHNQKSYVAHFFSYLDIMNVLVLLKVLLTLHNGYASEKGHVALHSDHIDLTNVIGLPMMQSVL